MAARAAEIVALAMFVAAAFWSGAVAQSTSCTNVLISMSPCLNYIQGNTSTPSSSCCSQLASVVKSSPECLCQVLNGGGSSIGVNINQTQALALPKACNVQTPPQSGCDSSSSPSPTSSSTTPSGSGSKTTPSTNGGGDSSDGNSTKLTFTVLLFALVAAAFSTI